MSICSDNITICKDVLDFIINVKTVGEESITDYLLWQWELSNQANSTYIHTLNFTKFEESTITGADLEVWIKKDNLFIPLLFQAKKFIKKYNSYVKAFQDPNRSKGQIQKLESYCNQPNKPKLNPFYLIYTNPDNQFFNACKSNCGVYVLPFQIAKMYSNSVPNTKLSKESILESSFPLFSFFCPCGKTDSSNNAEFNANLDMIDLSKLTSEEVPNHIKLMWSREFSQTDFEKLAKLDGEIDYPRRYLFIDMDGLMESENLTP